MTHFHTIDDLFDMLIRSGRGMAIIVEGETYADDAFFYGRWFGGQAGQISFYPQDGWPQVVTAIRALRQRISASRVQMPVYGIIDRDEMPGVAQTLDAAALTYVAAFMSSLLHLFYLLALRRE